QDVYKTEVRIIKGHGKHDVKTYKFEILKESIPMPDDSNKKKRDKSTKPEDNLDIHPNKCQHRQTNENEKKILKPILNSDTFSEDKALEILNQLLDYEEGWTLQ
ncbi:5919_t:CDS:1, partial [Cetraspora pellucida]